MSDTTTTKPNYKKTLNLPRTGFPMRANLAQNEPQSQKRYAQMKLYERICDARADGAPFVFHDGPPYANGDIHVGHLLNKVLKDIVVRSKLMAGRHCPFVPGWDCHGLPIEHRVMQELIEKGKAAKLDQLGEDDRRMAIRRTCQQYAEKYVTVQSAQLKRLSTLADYDQPYLTMSPAYEKGVLEVFAKLVERGVVYRALKSVHWSIANQTALAEAELEYEDREDISVYVDFEAADCAAVGEAFGIELDETPSFMIWTTTPWTLPANLAIAVHKDFTYALVRLDGSLTIAAKDLVEQVAQTIGATEVEILAEVSGEQVVGLSYRHPFCDRTSPVVAAEYVTLEDGTGLVHTAPGHGEDDYQTGLREGLDIYCPVLADGTFDDTVPDWLQSVLIWDANNMIVEHLRESGHLAHAHPFTHSYPHDWRSRTPVIFRATEQWFIGVDKGFVITDKTNGSESVVLGDGSLRARALVAAENDIRFIPTWGRNRMRGMLESRPDWCLSRQRSWGLPIPAFENNDGEVFLTAASVRAVAEVVGEKGSDAWFTEPVDILLGKYDVESDPDAPEWIKAHGWQSVGLQKMYDIFDVWFESGSSWNAVLRERGLGYPADLYLEGSDQHRGWFQLSLLPALGVTGVSPFTSVLTHGFMVGKDGRKMSKSLGNALDVEDLLREYGADVCRWWVSSLAFENDIKVDQTFFTLAGESYRKVRNTLRFLLGNLFDFDASIDLTAIPPTTLDGWALAMTAKLAGDVREAYETYQFRRAHQLLYDFCNETMSAIYCAAVKDRLYCDAAESARRRRTQAVMREIVDVLTRLLAPIVPHTADEAFAALGSGDTSVHLQTFLDLDFTADADWAKVLDARDKALKALEEAKAREIENPLDAGLIVPDRDGVFARFAEDFADLCGVSRVVFDPEVGEVVVNDLRGEPRCDRCWKRPQNTSPRADGGTLCARCASVTGA